jgi:drug/metabolite transporter (DMT)-like permease
MKELLAHVTAFELVGLRFGIGLPVLWGLLRAKRIPWGFDRRDLRVLAVGSGIILVHFLAQPIALSLEATTATNTGWIISFSPLGIVLLSRVFLGERLRARQIQGIALATVGVLALVSKGDFGSWSWLRSTGDWIILGTAFTWALYTIVTRDLSRRRSPLAVTFLVFLPLCLVGIAAIALGPDPARLLRLPPRAMVDLLLLGVLGTLAQWFWQLGVARIGAARAGIFVYLEPLATTALAVPLLGESFRVATAVGGALLLLGVWQAERGPALFASQSSPGTTERIEGSSEGS